MTVNEYQRTLHNVDAGSLRLDRAELEYRVAFWMDRKNPQQVQAALLLLGVLEREMKRRRIEA